MKITTLYVYPIKALRGIPLPEATLTPQGVKYDRTFMLLKVEDDGNLKKLQLDSHPACALFHQDFDDEKHPSSITVRYHPPQDPVAPQHPLQSEPLRVPLQPDHDSLEPVHINLHNSHADARRMGGKYDEWFSACFGFKVIMVYLGDAQREVLGTLSPKATTHQQASPGGLLAFLLPVFQAVLGFLSFLTGGLLFKSSLISMQKRKPGGDNPDWLTFTDCSPFLVASESSLDNVSARFPPEDQPVPMIKFRPNIVVDGQGEEAWNEDYWAELRVSDKHNLLLTANCVRCTSLNVDYATGRKGEGESGKVLQKLTRDRRVDKGNKYSPVFGRYAFLGGDETGTVRLGDEVVVVRRNQERTVHDWPLGGESKKSNGKIEVKG